MSLMQLTKAKNHNYAVQGAGNINKTKRQTLLGTDPTTCKYLQKLHVQIREDDPPT